MLNFVIWPGNKKGQNRIKKIKIKKKSQTQDTGSKNNERYFVSSKEKIILPSDPTISGSMLDDSLVCILTAAFMSLLPEELPEWWTLLTALQDRRYRIQNVRIKI